jgi:hypothetical protein
MKSQAKHIKLLNKKFQEELIAYFPFTVILVSDITSREKTLVYRHNEAHGSIVVKAL